VASLTVRSELMRFTAGVVAAVVAGCAASIPEGKYGVSSIEIRGTEHVEPDAIEVCLATHARERFGFVLGGAKNPQCGVPPFDASRYPLELWAWPWTDWPLFNQTAFERDQDRIERWFRARGYYDARVTSAQIERDEEAREVDVTLTVAEGEPVLIMRIDVLGCEQLDPEVRAAVREAVELDLGEPFDEALFERSKRDMIEVLQEASHAKAEVTGKASVDPVKKLARVTYVVTPGPSYRFGDVSVEGNGSLPARPIRAAAGIDRGQRFSLSAMRDARFAVFGLGPFASVEVEHYPRPESPVVDVIVRVAPARVVRFGVGVGMSAGGLLAQEGNDVSGDPGWAQWDLHLLGKFEHKNLLGGMRNLRVEDRPRLIFNRKFPNASESGFGNLLTVELRQPAFAEARTTLVARTRWDRGPDPYGGRFYRDDLVIGVGPERRFLQSKLRLSSTVNADLFRPEEEIPYPEYDVFYLYQVAQLDLRDDARNTTRGAYFALGVQTAGYFLPGDFNYVRVTQDNRGYLPLTGALVLAGRFRIGFMEITDTSVTIPEASETFTVSDQIFRRDLAEVGPHRHRLRGGGPNSVRGYAPNTLGDVAVEDDRLISGGLRQWEASIELRARLTESFGAVLFVDAGDVARPVCDANSRNCHTAFRFDYPHTSFGVGLRYHTIVGPLRLDAAVAPEDLQIIGEGMVDQLPPEFDTKVLGMEISFTIGEAF